MKDSSSGLQKGLLVVAVRVPCYGGAGVLCVSTSMASPGRCLPNLLSPLEAGSGTVGDPSCPVAPPRCAKPLGKPHTVSTWKVRLLMTGGGASRTELRRGNS